MFCMKCGKELPDDAKFCLSCGAPLPVQEAAPEKPQEASAPAVEAAPEAPEVKKPKNTKKALLIGIVAAVAVVCCLVVGLLIINKPAQGKLEELYNLSAYSSEFFSIELVYYDGSEFLSHVESGTSNSEDDRLLRQIRNTELVQVKGRKGQALVQRVQDAEHIAVTLHASSYSFKLTVSVDGEVIVHGADPETGEDVYYQGGEEIYGLLEPYMPAFDRILLGDFIPEGATGSIMVSAAATGEDAASVWIQDEELTAACVAELRFIPLDFLEGSPTFTGELVRIDFILEGVGVYGFEVLGYGEGSLEMDGWVYYVDGLNSILGPVEWAIRNYA